MSIDMYCVCIG